MDNFDSGRAIRAPPAVEKLVAAYTVSDPESRITLLCGLKVGNEYARCVFITKERPVLVDLWRPAVAASNARLTCAKWEYALGNFMLSDN